MIKKPKKRFKFLTFSIIVFILSTIFFGAGTVFLKTYANSMIHEKQELQARIIELEVLNEKIINDIKLIDSENHINIEELLSQTKLTNNPDNIVEINSQDN